MDRSKFVYVTFIRTTPAKLWQALTERDFIKQYWFGYAIDCAWTKGASWKMSRPDGTVTDAGEIVEVEPLRRMVIAWRNEWNPEMRAEGPSRCTIELEEKGPAVKLTVTHEVDKAESKFINAVSGGWPSILSNLKSLLETGAIVLVDH